MNKKCPLPSQEICDANCEWFVDGVCIIVTLTKTLQKLHVSDKKGK